MPFRFWEDGVELVRQDLNAISKALLLELYDRLVYETMGRFTSGFFGDAFRVDYSSAGTVVVKKGLGFQHDGTRTSPEGAKRPLFLAADTVLNLEAPDSTHPRIDLVCVKSTEVDALTAARKFKPLEGSEVETIQAVTQKDWEADLMIVTGTPGASPEAPAVPAGYMKIAELAVTAVTGLGGVGAVTRFRTELKLSTPTTQFQLAYAAVIGSGPYATHASINELMEDDAFTGGKVLITDSAELDEKQEITKDNVTLEFAPEVTYTSGDASTGLEITGGGVRIIGGRFNGFATTAIAVLSDSSHVMIMGAIFSGNTKDIDDQSERAAVAGCCFTA